MLKTIKLWKRTICANNSSRIDELADLSNLNLSKPLAICLPGMSTVHNKGSRINGYMGLIENVLGGRLLSKDINILSLSYNSTDHEIKNIKKYNDSPLSFYSQESEEFSIKVLSFFLEKKIDVNLFCKSYGGVFAGMSMNALYDLGFTTDPHQIRILSTGSVSRLSFKRRNTQTEIIIEGSNDYKAKQLNEYKEKKPENHVRLTISPIDKNTLHVLSDIRDATTIRKKNKRVYIKDRERHTVLLYISDGNKNHSLATLITRISRNMINLHGSQFGIETCLDFDDCTDGGSEIRTPKILNSALERGVINTKIVAVLFDWDLTLANGEEVNLMALNKTFHKMSKKYGAGESPVWSNVEMREHFSPTVPVFFKKYYADKSEIAIKIFRKERFGNMSRIKLIPGAKRLLGILKEKGIRVAIVSNKEQDELEAQVMKLLGPQIHREIPIIGNTASGGHKPSPKGIHKALNRLNLKRDDLPSVMFVGDKLSTDIQAAINAGCKPCLLGEYDKLALAESAKKFLGGTTHFTKFLDQEGGVIFHFDSLDAITDYFVANGGNYFKY